jgi:hypothetical protein
MSAVFLDGPWPKPPRAPTAAQIRDAAKPRDVSVGYTARHGGCYAAGRFMPGADVLTAVAVILEDLAIDAEALRVREIACGGVALALVVRTPHPAGRVVAIVREGLTAYDLNLALLRLTPAGAA